MKDFEICYETTFMLCILRFYFNGKCNGNESIKASFK